MIVLIKPADVVLERVLDPAVLKANIADALVCVPVVRLGQSFVNAVVEVFVVGEDDVATDIIKLRLSAIVVFQTQFVLLGEALSAGGECFHTDDQPPQEHALERNF